LYWDLARLILDRQATYGWGAKIVVRLAADLQREFPDIKGLSAGNLHYMRRFATVWPDRANLPTAVGKIPWGHNRLLLDRLSDTDERAWYAAATIEYGWDAAVIVIPRPTSNTVEPRSMFAALFCTKRSTSFVR
jgi:predicted nuclease of restriction endonuclease-like (RecB) superfamily